jgi:hypothetical protein
MWLKWSERGQLGVYVQFQSYSDTWQYGPNGSVNIAVKSKEVPLHAMEVLWGRGIMTSALDGDEWSASCPGRALPPGKGPPVPTGQKAGWTSELVLDTGATGKILCLCWVSNFNHPVFQSVAKHYTDWATPAPNIAEIWAYVKRYEILQQFHRQ